MLSAHVDFLKAIINKPLHLLRRDFESAKNGRKSSTLTPNIPNVVIDGIFEEEFLIDPAIGKKKLLHRIFAKSQEAPEYVDVGWILNDDIEVCMLCRKAASGVFSYKHHCKACGNIFCSDCTQNVAPIRELRCRHPFRVCNLCYFGQDIVDATHSRPKPTQANPGGSSTPIFRDYDRGPPPEETPEERMRKLKMAQQEEFQRAAMERLRAVSQPPQIGKEEQQRPSNLGVRQSIVNDDSTAPSGKASTPGSRRGDSSRKDTSSKTVAATDLTNMEVDAEERRRRMQACGPLTVVTPSPAFVVKTKRPSSTKLFVNFTTSPSVPYKPERESAKVDATKIIYLLVSTPLEHQNPKDGTYCVLYDVVVHPDEVSVCQLDAEGAYRARLIAQALQTIVHLYGEEVAMAPKILQVAQNYKSADTATTAPSTSGVPVRPVLVPCAEAFALAPQLAAVPMPVDYDERLSAAGSVPVTTSGAATPTPRMSVAAPTGPVSRASVVMQRGSVLLESVGDSSGLGVDRALKAMVLPREEVQRLFGKNFNFVLEALKVQEVNLKDVLLYPQPGFVLAVQRVRPAQRLYVNVAHHIAVGAIGQSYDSGAEHAAPSTGASAARRRASAYVLPSNNGGHGHSHRGSLIPRPLPYVLGQVQYEVADPLHDAQHAQGNNTGRATVVDVIVPSAVFFACLQDSTGDVREQLAKEVLLRLSDLGLKLQADFQLLSAPLYLATQEGQLPDFVPPVLNLTEEEKSRFSVAFVGKLTKQGHGVRNWKERLVFVAEHKLQYFDLKMNFKGEFHVEDSSFITCTEEEVKSLAPPTSTPQVFRLINYSSGGQFLHCAVSTPALRDLYELVLQTRNAHLTALKTLIQIPPLHRGWLLKQGHLVRNWKKRFFVLNYGMLAYYEQDNVANAKGKMEAPKGKVNLKGASVSSGVAESDNAVRGSTSSVSGAGARSSLLAFATSSGGDEAELRLCVTDSTGSKLYVQAKNADDKKEWFEALRRHIIYANEYND